MQDKALLVCYNFPLFVAPYLMWEPESLVCSGQLGVSRQGRFPAHALKFKKILQLIIFFYYAEGLDSESEIRNPQKKTLSASRIQQTKKTPDLGSGTLIRTQNSKDFAKDGSVFHLNLV